VARSRPNTLEEGDADAEEEAGGQREAHEQDRVGQGAAEAGRDRLAGGEGLSEVEAGQIAKIEAELDEDGAIEVEASEAGAVRFRR
jgi:hypothetical protein